MFTLTKNARIHESNVAEKFPKAEVDAMTKEKGTAYYAFPFTVPVIGCGDSPPDDYDQNGRAHLGLDETYTDEALFHDVSILIQNHGRDLIVRGLNRGIDLELRAKARPKPKAKMKDADKCLYIITHHGDIIPDLDGPADYVRWYDENVA